MRVDKFRGKQLIVFFFFAFSSASLAKDYVITQYGVGTDSTEINTEAIQKVIDRAHADGGGTIVVPKGVFLSGALFFKPNTTLRIAEGGVLKGSDDIADYPLIPSRMEGRKLDYFAALVNAYEVDGFGIEGPGRIDGNGLRFWKTFWAYRDSLRKLGRESTNLEVHRPRLIFIWNSDHVKINGVELRNAGFWTTHLYQCNDVLIEHCDIRSPFAPVKAPSTDGIDLDVCKRVTIRNCYISVNDDAIAIKGGKGPNAHQLPENGPVEDILIENCTFGDAHAALTFGSECIHGHHVTMRNCKVENNCPILHLKMRPDTYQTFENITLENITGRCGTIISMKPWTQFFDMGGSSEKPFGTVKNITISNVRVTCKEFGEIQGNPMDRVQDIVFRNVEVTAENPALKTSYEGVSLENVTVNGTRIARN